MFMLQCYACGKTYQEDKALWKCACGGYFLHTAPGLKLSKEKIHKGPTSLWRYQEVLPVSEEHRVTMGEGLTPLLPVTYDGSEIFLKLDFLQPTGSYKDRGTSVLISKLKEWGVSRIVEDSSGNAGASMAAYCARAGIGCEIYVPSYTSAGKIAQIACYGAELVKVPGTREDTAMAALRRAEEIFYASHNWSPYFIEGTKTLALELWEQLGWQGPDAVIVPVGNGSLVLGLYKGFRELVEMGHLGSLPRIIAVQSANCSPVYRAFHQGWDFVEAVEKQATLAEGIASAAPVKGAYILRAIKESRGTVIAVREEEIKRALFELGRMGVFVEPTSATVWAAWKSLKEQGNWSQGGKTVLELTGSGLKATEKLLEFTE